MERLHKVLKEKNQEIKYLKNENETFKNKKEEDPALLKQVSEEFKRDPKINYWMSETF